MRDTKRKSKKTWNLLRVIGRTWNGKPDSGWFRCRQTGEIQEMKIKVVEED